MIKIDKNIPPPERFYGKATEFPFEEMVAGDSFLAPFEHNSGEEQKIALREKVRNAAAYYRRNHGGSFAVREVQEGVRCWRTA